jgi:ribosome maturation factor RimP
MKVMASKSNNAKTYRINLGMGKKIEVENCQKLSKIVKII